MLKWYEETEKQGLGSCIISSRIRLVRNWEAYRFPAMLEEKESEELVRRMEIGLKELPRVNEKRYEFSFLKELEDLDRRALRERRVLSRGAADGKRAAGLILSEDEATGIVINGDDHLRLQLLSGGLDLEGLWEQADGLDDFINRQFPYAYDQRYGYLTSFPTNVGTGLKASAVVHLPILSRERKFPGLIAGLSRFGTAIRGVFGEGDENFGSLYEISNQKTLGQSEKEIVHTVAKAALQLANQESAARKLTIQNSRLEREDELFKSYGVLKYARRLTSRDAMIFLAQLMTGLSDGLMKLKEPCSVYRLMLCQQPANLQKLSERPLGKEELDAARADFIRKELPELE